jgi:plasmid stabilization system protein ParE
VFRVESSPRVLDELVAIAVYIGRRGSLEIAERWVGGFEALLMDLGTMPARHPIISESEQLGFEIRLLLYGRGNRAYKAYYSVDLQARIVRVFHVRHWARRQPTAAELTEFSFPT